MANRIPKKDVFFSDFMTNMEQHPASGQLARVMNEKSVSQSLRNLIMTNVGERLYQPRVGGNVLASVFEMNDNFAINDLKDNIKTTIFNNEPRVAGVKVEVVPQTEDYSVRIVISYTMHNSQDVFSTEVVLKKVR